MSLRLLQGLFINYFRFFIVSIVIVNHNRAVFFSIINILTVPTVSLKYKGIIIFKNHL